MGRRFTSTSNERIYVGSAGLAGLDFRYGTVAVVCNITAFTAPAETLFATNDGTGASWSLYTSSVNTIRMYDGTSDRLGISSLSSGVYYLFAFTKTSGTTTGRFHMLNMGTGVWTHANSGGTTVDSAAGTAVAIGCYANGSNDPFNGEIWAVGAWNKVVMTDSEVERLARGDWGVTGPDFLEYFTDGHEVGDMGPSLGRFKCKQTARTGTTRGALKPPPGFRMPRRRR